MKNIFEIVPNFSNQIKTHKTLNIPLKTTKHNINKNYSKTLLVSIFRLLKNNEAWLIVPESLSS